MRAHHDQGKKPSRWDKMPDKDVKLHRQGNKHTEESRKPETTIDMEESTYFVNNGHEKYRSHHDQPGIPSAKANGKGHYERKPKRLSGYMRGWDDDKEALNERPDKDKRPKKRDDVGHNRNDENLRFSERSDSYSIGGSKYDGRENEYDGDYHRQSSRSDRQSHYRARDTDDEESKWYGNHKDERDNGRDVGDGGHHRSSRSDEQERTPDGRDRGRKRTRSETPRSSRCSPESNESSYLKASKRKYKHRSRSRSSSSESRSSSEERQKKRKKKDKKGDKSKQKDKHKEERRSILTGKKIKLKVKKDKGDYMRDANREELLQFLNSAYE